MEKFNKILMEQREELKEKFEKEKIIERENLSYFEKLIKSNLIKIITGIRRCGKSVLSFQLLKNKKFGYINFDDEKLGGIEIEKLDHLMETIYEIYGAIDYLFLDEVQNINKWELFVNRLHRQGLNVIVTGSNAKLLSKELATHLTGRHIAFELLPFSFKEFLKYKEIDLKTDTTKQIGIIKKNLNEYIENGGFPETLKEPNPKIYLKSLYSTILLKDILLRHRVRYVKTFKDLANYIVSNFAREISYNKLKNVFNLGSDHTAKNYLEFLQESYLIFIIEKFSFKKKESLMENRKVYAIDTGMIKAISFRFTEDISHLYENVIALELIRKQTLNKNIETYYWKNPQQEEVDFVIKEGLKIKQIIQVCYNITDYDTKKREIRALLKASRELRCKNLLVITEDKEDTEIIDKKKINYIPLWKWLLNN